MKKGVIFALGLFTIGIVCFGMTAWWFETYSDVNWLTVVLGFIYFGLAFIKLWNVVGGDDEKLVEMIHTQAKDETPVVTKIGGNYVFTQNQREITVWKKGIEIKTGGERLSVDCSVDLRNNLLLFCNNNLEKTQKRRKLKTQLFNEFKNK